MKYLKQFFLILFISFMGELLNDWIPLAIPGSIYGLALLLLALLTGVIRLPRVREAAHFLIEIMPILFVPAVVGLLDKWDALRPILVPVSIITVVSLILTFGVSGRVTQLVVRLRRRRKESGGDR